MLAVRVDSPARKVYYGDMEKSLPNGATITVNDGDVPDDIVEAP